MIRLAAFVTLARDVLLIAQRRRMLPLCLVLSTALTLLLLAGTDVIQEGEVFRLELFGFDPLGEKTGDPRVVRPSLVLSLIYIVYVTLGLAGAFGVGLGVLACMDAVSSAFEPGRAELVLPRPISRGEVVCARFAGALAFGLLQGFWPSLLLFLGSGLKLGVWHAPLLLLGPGLVLKYGVVLAICSLMVVVSRSRAIGIMISGGAWVTSYVLNMFRHAVTREDLSVFETPVFWAQRLLPQIPHQDLLAAWTCNQELSVDSAALVLAQGVAWILLPLAATVLVVHRRDH